MQYSSAAAGWQSAFDFAASYLCPHIHPLTFVPVSGNSRRRTPTCRCTWRRRATRRSVWAAPTRSCCGASRRASWAPACPPAPPPSTGRPLARAPPPVLTPTINDTLDGSSCIKRFLLSGVQSPELFQPLCWMFLWVKLGGVYAMYCRGTGLLFSCAPFLQIQPQEFNLWPKESYYWSLTREFSALLFFLSHLNVPQSSCGIRWKTWSLQDFREQHHSHRASFPSFCLHLHHDPLIQHSGRRMNKSEWTSKVQQRYTRRRFLPPATFFKAQVTSRVKPQIYLQYTEDSSLGHVYLFMLKYFVYEECVSDCQAIWPQPSILRSLLEQQT